MVDYSKILSIYDDLQLPLGSVRRSYLVKFVDPSKEYNAPSDFECVWQKDVNVAIRPNKTLAQVEKLFKFSPTNVQ